MANDKDSKNSKDVRGGDTDSTDEQGKGAGSEKGDQHREYRQHTGQTRNSPGARRTEKDEQAGEPNNN